MDSISALNGQTIIPSSTGVTGQTAAELAAADAEEQITDFLELLLTQLENQNPLDPLDTDEWTAQLTRFSILEQGIETNEQLTVTNDLLQTSASQATFAYIGQNVEVISNITAAQNGQAMWSYAVQGQAGEVTLTVTDENGTILHTAEGSIEAGAHDFTLDIAAEGLDIEDGQELYLSVNAISSNDQPLETDITSHVTVDGVWTDQTQSYLTAGDISFRTTDILKVAETEDETETGTTTL